jgi:NADH-quinone oxidoreductase subunit E
MKPWRFSVNGQPRVCDAEDAKTYVMALLTSDIDLSVIDSIIARSGSNPESLIGILQDIQREFNYLPMPALKRVGEKLAISQNRVWAVATFYDAFTLEPKGRNHIMVCTGTACHVRGAAEIIRALEDSLLVEAGHTTPDGEFSIECAHCLGACAMGPVVVLNGEYHGHMNRAKSLELLDNARLGEGGES